jgi:hypothetical protein
MATNIQIEMKDGTAKRFLHKGRPGGSYTKSLRYESGFVVIKDEYGDETSIPTADIKEIQTWRTRT